jgi:hypothetical protein
MRGHQGPQEKTRPPRSVVKIADGWWPRFSRYEIVDGYIGPAPDATMRRYELWEQPVKAYESLTNIVRQQNGRNVGLLEWCRQHGLLGLLLHRAEYVAFPTRKNDDGGERQTTLRRIPEGWQLGGSSTVISESLPTAEPAGVTLHGLTSTETTVESLDSWNRFFPSVRGDQLNDSAFPHPNDPHDERFWRLYAEPLTDFLEAAEIIADSLLTIATNRQAAKPDYGGVSDHTFAVARLNGCTSSIRLFAKPNTNGTVAIRWRAHTLFASLALMALQDMASDALPRLCAECGEFFVSTAWQSRYCSERCRWAINKRTQRQRKARGQRRRGRPIREKAPR